MAEEYKTEQNPTPTHVEGGVETQDRGLFGFGKKKADDQEVIASEFGEKVQVSEVEEKKPSLAEKLKRSDSNSSSSSSDEEEVGEDGEKRKKKKGLKEKLKEKTGTPTSAAPVGEAPPAVVAEPPLHTEEKKGLLGKIKDKLPGHNKKPEEVPVVAPPPPPVVAAEEKKGLLEKIKDKIPGFHSKTDEEKEKEKAKE